MSDNLNIIFSHDLQLENTRIVYNSLLDRMIKIN